MTYYRGVKVTPQKEKKVKAFSVSGIYRGVSYNKLPKESKSQINQGIYRGISYDLTN